ncbi:MAG: hypothetical protein OEV55_07565, partial [candidate division Zixibacteria bacterium]|nr:hypothetical protein [candidate division Zixibacteria bacterium]
LLSLPTREGSLFYPLLQSFGNSNSRMNNGGTDILSVLFVGAYRNTLLPLTGTSPVPTLVCSSPQ